MTSNMVYLTITIPERSMKEIKENPIILTKTQNVPYIIWLREH
jgi:hypothetical protein